jgi:hypothetical protein
VSEEVLPAPMSGWARRTLRANVCRVLCMMRPERDEFAEVVTTAAACTLLA